MSIMKLAMPPNSFWAGIHLMLSGVSLAVLIYYVLLLPGRIDLVICWLLLRFILLDVFVSLEYQWKRP